MKQELMRSKMKLVDQTAAEVNVSFVIFRVLIIDEFLAQ